MIADALKNLSAQELHETLRDGADLPVTHTDGHTETVKVRKIPRAEFGAYALAVHDDSEAAELAELLLYVPGKDAAWLASLTEESRDALQAEGDRLNFTNYARWYRRRARAVKLVRSNAELEAQTLDLMQAYLARHGSTSGSSPRATAMPTSGATAPPS